MMVQSVAAVVQGKNVCVAALRRLPQAEGRSGVARDAFPCHALGAPAGLEFMVGYCFTQYFILE